MNRASVARSVALVVILTACGSASANLGIVGSSPSSIGVGEQRVVMAEVDPETSSFLGSPEEAATATFVGPDGSEQVVDADWVWSIPDVRGFLIARPVFETSGTWTAALTSPRGTTSPISFQVNDVIPLPEVGDPAPPSETRTIDDFPIEQLTTDPDPDRSLYEMTVADAVSNGTPSVIVFATPAFCQTAVCGPTMDLVKAAIADRTGFDTVHVEVFENIESEGAGQLIEVDAIFEWGLPSEPWVYVVDADGLISARFEGAVSTAELSGAIDAVVGS